MNLNGGYIMLDLDDTASLTQDKINTILNSGKPLMILKDGKASFATLDYTANASTASISLSNGVKYTISLFSHTVTESYLYKKYRHISAFTASASGVTQKFVIEVISTNSSKYTTVGQILGGLYESGHTSEDTMTLCVYSGNYAQVYVTKSSNINILHYKPSDATTFITLNSGTSGTFVSDTVVEI